MRYGALVLEHQVSGTAWWWWGGGATHRKEDRRGAARKGGTPGHRSQYFPVDPARNEDVLAADRISAARGRTHIRADIPRAPVGRVSPCAGESALSVGSQTARDALEAGAGEAPVEERAPQTGGHRDRSRHRQRSREGAGRHQPAWPRGDRRRPGARHESGAAGEATRAAPRAALGTSRGEGCPHPIG